MYAEGRVDGVPGIVDAHDEVECTEAVKQVHILNYPKRRCSLNRNVHNHFFSMACLGCWQLDLDLVIPCF